MHGKTIFHGNTGNRPPFPSGGDSVDELVKVSDNDSVPGTLEDKLIVCDNILKTVEQTVVGGCPIGKTFYEGGTEDNPFDLVDWTNGATIVSGSLSPNQGGCQLFQVGSGNSFSFKTSLTVVTGTTGTSLEINTGSNNSLFELLASSTVSETAWWIKVGGNYVYQPLPRYPHDEFEIQVECSGVNASGTWLISFKVTITGGTDEVIEMNDIPYVQPNIGVKVNCSGGTTNTTFLINNCTLVASGGLPNDCTGEIFSEQLKLCAIETFVLPFKFTRASLQGNYASGDMDLPYVTPSTWADQIYTKNYGVDVTADSNITFVNFQFADIAAGSEFEAYIKVYDPLGVETKTILSTVSNTLKTGLNTLHQTYAVGIDNMGLDVFVDEFVIFGVNRIVGAGTIPIVGATATAYIRTLGA